MLNIDKRVKPIAITAIVAFIAIMVYLYLKISTTTQVVSGDKFNKILATKQVDEVYIKDNYFVAITDDSSYKVVKDAINKKEILSKYPIKIYSKSSTALISTAVLILLVILVILIVLLRKNQSFKSLNFQPQSNKSDLDDLIKDIKPEFNPQYRFKNIAGISEVKEDLEDIISFLKDPQKYQKYGIRMPKGMLLVGPPGVGKTLISKAISAEAGVPFFYSSGASFVHIYAGAGAKRVKELFKKAKELAPSIIFIDEIDAVGKSRDSLDSNEREATLNQLLVEMDGFSQNEGVVVIGATNRLEILDSALLRAGRFDRRVFIGLPNLKEREQIVNLYLEEKKHNIDTLEIAKLTAGFSPASIETLINEAALKAYKRKRETISNEDIYLVKDQVIYGKKIVSLLTREEREIQASYQAAKAVVAVWVGFNFQNVKLLTPININEDVNIVSKSSLLNVARVYISGIIYLERKYNDSFSIAISDKNRFKEILEKIVNDYYINIEYNIDSITRDIRDDIEGTLKRLDGVILKVSTLLNDNESVNYSDIKSYLDEVL